MHADVLYFIIFTWRLQFREHIFFVPGHVKMITIFEQVASSLSSKKFSECIFPGGKLSN
jgi:hypothetical protein